VGRSGPAGEVTTAILRPVGIPTFAVWPLKPSRKALEPAYKASLSSISRSFTECLIVYLKKIGIVEG
jgi:hypothetical protein